MLRERISTLSAAILRISSSLDLDTVLQDVLESARTLTGARYGVITTVDGSGQPQDFFTSGLTAEKHGALVEWPDGLRLFEHFRSLPEALRIEDFSAYLRSLGYAEFKWCRNLHATPMHRRGEHIGSFFLANKEGGQEFTDADEEVLLLFASQAAMAIANARTHRQERRTLADLEALVETSPVGIVVFNAKTGAPRTFNHQARRIAEALHMADLSPAELLESLTSRLADGREATIEQLQNAETLRAAEVELSVPDGRSVRLLINVTPGRSEDGEVESVVVTMQDLAQFQEFEQQRMEFLGMVSHELRTPLTSIQGATTTLLREAEDLDRAEMREFFRILDEQADHMRRLIKDLLDVSRIDTGTLSVAPEPVEVSMLVEQARNTSLSGDRHPVLIDLPRDLPRVMVDWRRIVQVLNNLLSNASRHSPESSPIRVSAVRDGVHVEISVSDEGKGVAPESLPHLFQKYRPAGVDPVHGLAGSGLGLAICKGLVEAHGGRIRAASGGVDQGMQVTFTIPVAEDADADADRSRSRRSGEPTRILVVDDDPQTLHYLRAELAKAGYSPLVTGDPHAVPDLIREEEPALVLLDLMLPSADGMEMMETITELHDLPVIFISGYGRDETIAKALENGATDYIVKPFSPTELTARIGAALRRRAAPEPFVFRDLAIDYEQRRVTLAGRRIELTPKEYGLLRVLSINPGKVHTYEALIRQLWGKRIHGDSDIVRTHVKTLRQKLGDSVTRPHYILNERGVGYRMPKPDDP